MRAAGNSSVGNQKPKDHELETARKLLKEITVKLQGQIQ